MEAIGKQIFFDIRKSVCVVVVVGLKITAAPLGLLLEVISSSLLLGLIMEGHPLFKYVERGSLHLNDLLSNWERRHMRKKDKYQQDIMLSANMT